MTKEKWKGKSRSKGKGTQGENELKMPFVLVVTSLSILQSKHTPAGSQIRAEELHSWEPPQSAAFPLQQTVAYDKEKKQTPSQIHTVSFSFFLPATSSEASVKDLSQDP